MLGVIALFICTPVLTTVACITGGVVAIFVNRFSAQIIWDKFLNMSED